MRRCDLALLLLGAACLPAIATAPAAAQDSQPADALSQQLFGRAVGASQAHVCFKRRYDAGHLATHPRQNVTAMLLLVSNNPDPEASSSYSVDIGVTFRNRKSHFEVGGFCSKGASGLDCGVECDGGKIDVAIRDGNSVLVKIPDGARVSRPGASGDDSVSGKTFGSDDKVFRLDRAGLSECLPIVHDAKKRGTLRRGG